MGIIAYKVRGYGKSRGSVALELCIVGSMRYYRKRKQTAFPD